MTWRVKYRPTNKFFRDSFSTLLIVGQENIIAAATAATAVIHETAPDCEVIGVELENP